MESSGQKRVSKANEVPRLQMGRCYLSEWPQRGTLWGRAVGQSEASGLPAFHTHKVESAHLAPGCTHWFLRSTPAGKR